MAEELARDNVVNSPGSYFSKSGLSTINGTVTVISRRVTVDGLAIKPEVKFTAYICGISKSTMFSDCAGIIIPAYFFLRDRHGALVTGCQPVN